MTTTGNAQGSTGGKTSEAKSKPTFELWDMSLRSLTLVFLVVGVGWTLFTYFENRRQEYEFTLYKERKEVYYPVCKAAAEIVSSRSLTEAAPAIRAFETLYYAGVRSVAEEDVNEAINGFAEALMDFKGGRDNEPPPFELITLSDDLSNKSMNALALRRVFGVDNESKRNGSKAPEKTAEMAPTN
ncbi:MAG: hypothetical protein AABO57_08440 [Acidobacteriota bacterium]